MENDIRLLSISNLLCVTIKEAMSMNVEIISVGAFCSLIKLDNEYKII